VNTALPTGWHGRLLALGLLAVALATIYVTVVMPLRGFYDDRQTQMARERQLIAKLDRVNAELPALQARLDRLRAAAANHEMALAGETDAIASAALQGRLEQYAKAAGVTIGSSEILPGEPAGDYHRVGLRLLVNGGYPGLLQLVARIETARPPLAIDNLQIRGMQSATPRAAPVGLDASLEVHGFRSTGTGRTKS
jgi:hypothetical protein